MDVVFSQYLDQELEGIILTEEAVRAFEAEEVPRSYRREYGTIISTAAGSVCNNSDDEEDNDEDNDDNDEEDNDDDYYKNYSYRRGVPCF